MGHIQVVQGNLRKEYGPRHPPHIPVINCKNRVTPTTATFVVSVKSCKNSEKHRYIPDKESDERLSDEALIDLNVLTNVLQSGEGCVSYAVEVWIFTNPDFVLGEELMIDSIHMNPYPQ